MCRSVKINRKEMINVWLLLHMHLLSLAYYERRGWHFEVTSQSGYWANWPGDLKRVSRSRWRLQRPFVCLSLTQSKWDNEDYDPVCSHLNSETTGVASVGKRIEQCYWFWNQSQGHIPPVTCSPFSSCCEWLVLPSSIFPFPSNPSLPSSHDSYEEEQGEAPTTSSPATSELSNSNLRLLP